MKRCKVTGSPLSPNLASHAHDGTDVPCVGKNGCGSDGHDLSPILAFLRSEIDHSSALLGDLAKHLSEALSNLTAPDDQDCYRSSLADAAIALQNEDRVRQRLSDLATALSVLERALVGSSTETGTDLYQSIVASLLLEETRQAFAVAVGMAETYAPTKAPSAGDVDLF